MRLLLDANLSPRLLQPLRAVGHQAVHVVELGLVTASDRIIFDRAEADRLVVVTADSDFPMLLALRRASSPSVVLLRGISEEPVEAQAELLVANLPLVADELEGGAVASLSALRLRVRRLPLR